MPDSSHPFIVAFDRTEKISLIAGPAVAFVFSARNARNQILSLCPVDLVYVTAGKEKIRQSGFLGEFVTEKGEALDPEQVAKIAPFMWNMKFPGICVGDQATLTVTAKEVSLVQSVTFLCTNSEPVRFEQSSCFLETPDIPLTKASFTAMMQGIIERYELLEDKAGINLRGLAAEGYVFDDHYSVTIRGEAIYARSADGGTNSFMLRLTAYKADGGVLKVTHIHISLSPNDPFEVFELWVDNLLEKPARLTVYPIMS